MTFKVLDSGQREDFVTGARRDIDEDKARLDLVEWFIFEVAFEKFKPLFINWLFAVKTYKELELLFEDRELYLDHCYFLISGLIINKYGELQGDFFDVFPPEMFINLGKHLALGAKKYGDNNWKKGIAIKRYYQSGFRHLLQYIEGDKTEDHFSAVLFNLCGIIWTLTHINIFTEEEREYILS